jgi:hypothetical protein
MKKKIMITMIIMLFLCVIAAGYGKTPAEKSAMSSATEIQKIIIQSIKYPDFGFKEGLHGDLTITFTVSAEGKIELKNISSQSDKLRDYVKDQLTNITISDVIHHLNQQYKVKLKFNMS